MKSSCIEHPANEPLIIIRQWQYEFCDGNQVAALVVGAFHLTHIGRIRLVLPATVVEIQQSLLEAYSINTVRDSVSYLKNTGAVRETEWSPQQAKLFTQTKIAQKINGKGYACEWCNGTTLKLHDHHCPVPKSEGGEHIVKICPNCHYEFHYLVDNKFYFPSDKLLNLFTQNPIPEESLL